MIPIIILVKIIEELVGNTNKTEVFGSLTLLALIHSVIEDTILIMLMGVHISGALFFRIFFALMIISVIIQLVKKLSDAQLERSYVYPEKPAPIKL